MDRRDHLKTNDHQKTLNWGSQAQKQDRLTPWKIDQKLSKFYLSRKGAGGRILKHPEMGSLGYKEAESTLKTPWWSQKFNIPLLAYVREEFSQFLESTTLTKTKINNITTVFNETVELDQQLKNMSVSKGTTADRNTLAKNLSKLKKSLKSKMGVNERDSASNRASSRNKQ